MLSNENSVLLLGLGDGRIVLYDLDGGDAAAAVTSALSIYRSLPLIIEEASTDVALGLSCSGSSIVLARCRLCLKLLDVRRNRNVVASMRVTHNKSIVAAVYQQAQRTGLIMLLQVMRRDRKPFVAVFELPAHCRRLEPNAAALMHQLLAGGRDAVVSRMERQFKA